MGNTKEREIHGHLACIHGIETRVTNLLEEEADPFF